MNKFITTLAALAVSLTCMGEITGDGYYRVQNLTSGRYIYVLDNHGSLNMQTTTADLGALEVWKGYERTISDPATVIYVKSTSSNGWYYDFQAQGTGVVEMINRSVRVRYYDDKAGKYYRVYGEDSGMARYIGDGSEETVSDKGYVSSLQVYSSPWIKWLFHPITLDDSNYFGVTPTVNVDGKWYAPFYAAFPFSTASEGMKVWYVSKIDNDKAVISEYNGVVPASFPVLIECASSEPSKNKLNIGGKAGSKPGSYLRGVYFKNETLSHPNKTPYDKATMRLFGTTSEGKAGFITSDNDKYVPRNQAYLAVPEGHTGELYILTEEEYNAGVANVDIDGVKVRSIGRSIEVVGAAGATVEVYNLAGAKIYDGGENRIELSTSGVFVVRVGGKAYKVVVR